MIYETYERLQNAHANLWPMIYEKYELSICLFKFFSTKNFLQGIYTEKIILQIMNSVL